jgi:hypothetical protein
VLVVSSAQKALPPDIAIGKSLTFSKFLLSYYCLSEAYLITILKMADINLNTAEPLVCFYSTFLCPSSPTLIISIM